MMLSGADIVIETLIEQGTEIVFGYPGGQVINLYDALYSRQDRIRHVLTAHEQGACHAADGYARATGKVGVVMATSGPGATNLVTGIATAYLDSIPLVAITGNVPNSLIGKDSFQEVDITGVTLPVTKHNFFVTDYTKLADTLREAFRIARSGRPGPVLVDIPKDVQVQMQEYEPAPVVEKIEQRAVKEYKLERAAQMIRESQRPYIYIGGGVISADAREQVLALAEKIDAPIGCTLMGLSAIPDDHPRFLGMEGMHGHYASSVAQDEADLIIAAGCRFSDRATGNTEKYARHAKVIHMDIDRAEVDKNVQSDLGIGGDLKEGLIRLLEKVEPKTNPAWNEKLAGLRELEAVQLKKAGRTGVLTPYALIREVALHTKAQTPVVTDVGQHQMWAAQFYPFKNNRTFISSGGLGTMGFGLGAAIGAALGTGEKTILFTGDGSFGMNLNELATAVSVNAPVVIFIFNNNVLGMVRQWQNLFFDGHYSQTTLNRKTDFVRLAEAFGARGLRIRGLDELAAGVKKAMSLEGPVVVDVTIDPDEFVLPMLPPGGSFDDIITEV